MKILSIIALAVLVLGGGYFLWQRLPMNSTNTVQPSPVSSLQPSPTPLPRSITITQPTASTQLPIGKTATVSGEAVGLFEGNVVIRLTDSTGKMIIEQPITVTDWMQETPVAWSTEISIPVSAAAGTAQLTAVNPSAKDASEDVSDTVTVELIP